MLTGKKENFTGLRRSRRPSTHERGFTSVQSADGADVFHLAGDVFILSGKASRPALAVQGSERRD